MFFLSGLSDQITVFGRLSRFAARYHFRSDVHLRVQEIGAPVQPNIIFRTPSDHRAIVAHARTLLERSRKLLQETLPNTVVRIEHQDSVPADKGLQFKPEVEAPVKPTTTDRETIDTLIRLTYRLLSHFGREIETDNQIFRCFVISEFVLAAYAVQPDVTVYRILQRDNEQNISQLFTATWHWGSGTADLQLYRDGPWEKTFRKIGASLAPSQHLH